MNDRQAGACAGKFRYPSPQAAHAAMREFLSRQKRRKDTWRLPPVEVYRCDVCGGHHFGKHSGEVMGRRFKEERVLA